MAIIYWLLLAGVFGRIGSKRVIGSFTAFFMVLLWAPIGIIFVLNSRRLNDEKRNLELIEKYKPAQII